MREWTGLRRSIAGMVVAAACAGMQAQAPSAGQVAGGGIAAGKETHITPEQGKELFRSVDQIMRFASDDTKFPIKHEVKRRLTTRSEVEKYITDRFHDDKDTKRMERSEIVLKKFGLLDRDFHLEPFLVSLLKEQIAGYYDDKTKTVNLLDWIEPDQQKPVLAHELTHALQDQHLDLEKWGDQSIEGISKTAESDVKHIETDEADTARDAVAEGQAMAVFVDWGLRGKGVTLRTIPNIMADEENNESASAADSPVLARAPLLLQQSLLFPYREGLNFEQVLLQDKGTDVAFEGALDHPPSSTFEVMNPRAYEAKVTPPLLNMPDIHPLLDGAYEPYDIGVMGELDVRMMAELFGGKPAGAQMAQQWKGGIYYAAHAKAAAAEGKADTTASVAIFYLSAWRSKEAAQKFAALYASSLQRKYTRVDRATADVENDNEMVFQTEEGPVLIANNGNQVFVSESFDLTLARKLQLLLEGAQNNGTQVNVLLTRPSQELDGALRNWLGTCGMMRVQARLH